MINHCVLGLLISSILITVFPRIMVLLNRYTLGINHVVAYATVYSFPVGIWSQTTSTWIVATMSVVRSFSMKYPFRSTIYTGKKQAKLTILIILLCALAYNIPRFFELKVASCNQANEVQQVATSIIIHNAIRWANVFYWALNLTNSTGNIFWRFKHVLKLRMAVHWSLCEP